MVLKGVFRIEENSPFVAPLFMCIGIGDFSSLSHIIFQVLYQSNAITGTNETKNGKENDGIIDYDQVIHFRLFETFR